MSQSNNKTESSSVAEQLALHLSPMAPTNKVAASVTRFITDYEADEYTNWIDESIAPKSACFIGTWSDLFKLKVKGPDAKALLEYLCTNSWPEWRVHTMKHAIMCRNDGKIMGDGCILKVGLDEYILTGVPANPWTKFQLHHGRRAFDCMVEDVTNNWYLLQVQGPKSVEVMEAATGTGIRDVPFLSAKEMSIDGKKFLALRQGVSGELGYELWGPMHEGPAVYKAVLAAGQRFGIRELGFRAKLVNHVEAGFATPSKDFAGSAVLSNDDAEVTKYLKFLEEEGFNADLFRMRPVGSYTSDPADHERTPFDVGWGWLVDFEHDFIGRDALKAVAANPPNKWVALEWNSDDVIDVFASLFRDDGEAYDYMEMPRNSDLVADGVYINGSDSKVGCAMSRCYSSWFRRMISHGIIATEYSEPGTKVLIKWGSSNGSQKMISATVKQAPYKEDKRRKKVTS